jgi:hypothetical protein
MSKPDPRLRYLAIEEKCKHLASKRMLSEKRLSVKTNKIAQFTQLHQTYRAQILSKVEKQNCESRERNLVLSRAFSDMAQIIDHTVTDASTNRMLLNAVASYRSKLHVSLPAFLASKQLKDALQRQAIERAENAQRKRDQEAESVQEQEYNLQYIHDKQRRSGTGNTAALRPGGESLSSPSASTGSGSDASTLMIDTRHQSLEESVLSSASTLVRTVQAGATPRSARTDKRDSSKAAAAAAISDPNESSLFVYSDSNSSGSGNGPSSGSSSQSGSSSGGMSSGGSYSLSRSGSTSPSTHETLLHPNSREHVHANVLSREHTPRSRKGEAQGDKRKEDDDVNDAELAAAIGVDAVSGLPSYYEAPDLPQSYRYLQQSPAKIKPGSTSSGLSSPTSNQAALQSGVKYEKEDNSKFSTGSPKAMPAPAPAPANTFTSTVHALSPPIAMRATTSSANNLSPTLAVSGRGGGGGGGEFDRSTNVIGGMNSPSLSLSLSMASFTSSTAPQGRGVGLGERYLDSAGAGAGAISRKAANSSNNNISISRLTLDFSSLLDNDEIEEDEERMHAPGIVDLEETSTSASQRLRR